MIDRINLILKAKNITARQFAEEIGIQPSGMSHIMSGRNRPSLDFVKKVINRYPEIDIKWLTFGDGEMYAPSIVAVPASSSNAPSAATASQTAVPSVSAPQTVPSQTPAAAPVAAPTTARPAASGNVRPVASAPVQPDLFSSMEGTLFADVPSAADVPVAVEADRTSAVMGSPAQGAAPYAPVAENNEAREAGTYGAVPPAGVSSPVPPAAHGAETVQASGVQMATAAPSVSTVPSVPPAPIASVDPVAAPAAFAPSSAIDMPMPSPSPKPDERRQQSYVDENRLNGFPSAVVPENQNLKRKKIVKVVVLYDDHSFSEYYPE